MQCPSAAFLQNSLKSFQLLNTACKLSAQVSQTCQPQMQIYVIVKLHKLHVYYELFIYQVAAFKINKWFAICKEHTDSMYLNFFLKVQCIFAQSGNMSDQNKAWSNVLN